MLSRFKAVHSFISVAQTELCSPGRRWVYRSSSIVSESRQSEQCQVSSSPERACSGGAVYPGQTCSQLRFTSVASASQRTICTSAAVCKDGHDGAKREGSLDHQLLSAAAQGDFKLLCELLQRGASPHTMFPEGTALHLAALKGNEQILDVLLRLKVDVEASNSIGATALMTAAAAGHIRTVERLIKSRANLDTRDSEGRTVLSYALSGHHTAIIKLLLEAGMDVNADASGPNKGMSYLHLASGLGMMDTVNLLLDNMANVNKQDALGHTALHFAAGSGHADVVRVLVECGADASIQRKDGRDAADIARVAEYYDVLDVLQPNGPHTQFRESGGVASTSDQSSVSSTNKLFRAIFDEDHKRARWLIREGADVNGRASVEFRGMTPLQLAASIGSLDMMRMLIQEHKAGPNVLGQLCGPLHEAVLATEVSPVNQLAMVRLLLDSGADVNLASKSHSRTALHWLCQDTRQKSEVSTAIAKMLVDSGADVGLRDGLGISAVEYAMFQLEGLNGVLLARCLVDSGAGDPGADKQMMDRAVLRFQDTALKAGLQEGSKELDHFMRRALTTVDMRVRVFNYVNSHQLWDALDKEHLEKLMSGWDQTQAQDAHTP